MKSPCKLFVIVLALVFSVFALSAAGAPQYASQSGNPAPSVPRVISTSMTGFGVPFSINDPDNRFIEVHLYVSKDRGQTWQYHDRTHPQETQFPYQSKNDGEYWFALKTLDRDRKLNPDGEPQPELKVIVDTRKPTLDLEVTSDSAGRLVCKWRAEDRFIDPATLQISYKAASDPTGRWKPIDYRPIHIKSTGNVFVDQLAWWPEIADQQVQVRVRVNDRAGNSVSGARNVYVPKIAARTSNVATANRVPAGQETGNYLAQGAPAQNGLQCSGGVCRLPTRTANGPPQLRVGSAPEYTDPPRPPGSPNRDVITAAAFKKISLSPQTQNRRFFDASGAAKQNVAKLPDTNISNRSTADPEAIVWETPEVASRSDQKQVVSSTAAGQGGNLFDRDRFESNQVLATASTAGHRNPLAIGEGVNRQTSGERSRKPITPPRRASNPEEADLFPAIPIRNVSQPLRERDDATNESVRPLPTASDFDSPIPKRNASDDGGRFSSSSSKKLKSINSRRFLLNYNIDAIDPSGVGKVVLWVTRNGGQTWSSMATDNDNQSPFPVQVDDDGEFGFRVVIHSKDGLVGRPPSRGDEADMAIRIDTEAPTGRIMSVPYGTGNDVGRLVINWRADDSRLRIKPIDLAYSTNTEGPWTNIEQGIRNTGSYSWKVERDIPERIYLRMAIHDAAGNTTLQKLTQPIDVSGLVPRGRINGVQAVTTQ